MTGLLTSVGNQVAELLPSFNDSISIMACASGDSILDMAENTLKKGRSGDTGREAFHGSLLIQSPLPCPGSLPSPR